LRERQHSVSRRSLCITCGVERDSHPLRMQRMKAIQGDTRDKGRHVDLAEVYRREHVRFVVQRTWTAVTRTIGK
jgi:hypothetical protein